jgi:predicted dehydrogenase
MRKILIFGAGVIAGKHAEAAMKFEPSCEVHAADPDPAARARFLSQFPGAILHESVGELLSVPAGTDDIAIICTPPWLHLEHVIAALKSGRHVLCEKPLAVCSREAEQMLACAALYARELHCCSSRFSTRPIVANIRALLGSVCIGDGLRLIWLSRSAASRSGIEYQPGSRWFLDKSKSGGGCLMDWGCYDVAVWISLFRPRAVTVQSAWKGYPKRGKELPEDICCDVEFQFTAALSLHLADGRTVPVQYERSTASYAPEINQFLIEGSNGSIEWDWLDWTGSSIRHRHDDDDGVSAVDVIEGDSDDLSCHERPLYQLLNTLEGRPSSAIANSEACNNFLLLQALYHSAETRQAVTVNFDN